MNTKLTIYDFEIKLKVDLDKFVNHVINSDYEYSYTEDDWYAKFADYCIDNELNQ